MIENVFWVMTGVVIMNFFIAYLVFARLTVHPIEKKIKEAGGDLPHWDSVGFRIPAYGAALMMPIKVEQAQLVDETQLQKFATQADRFRARYVMGSFVLLMVFAIIFLVFFDTEV